MISKNGGSAFPMDYQNPSPYQQEGMTLRDWLAGQAIQSPALLEMRQRIREHDLEKWFGGRSAITEPEIYAALAFQIADAMLMMRER